MNYRCNSIHPYCLIEEKRRKVFSLLLSHFSFLTRKKDTYGFQRHRSQHYPYFVQEIRAKLKIIISPVCSLSPHIYIYICVCVCAKENYSAIKKNAFLPFATAWMDLEGIMFSKISYTEKDNNCTISLIC